MKNGNPQVEDGYTRIANEIMDALARYRIPGEQMQCLFFILRKTYGWNKKTDAISLSQFVDATGLSKPHICRSLCKLKQRNIIVAKTGNTKVTNYRFNKKYKSWKPLPKRATVAKKGNKSLPKRGHTKDTSTKDTRTSSLTASRFGFIDPNLLKRISGRWPQVYLWLGKCLKHKKNKSAIVHVLSRMDKTPGLAANASFWGFTAKVLGAEDGNYNALEFDTREAQRQKAELKQMVGNIGEEI